MEQRKEIVRHYVSRGLPVLRAVRISGISKSSYYHRSNGRPKGKRASETTLFEGKPVPNGQVVSAIEEILSNDFLDYGYQSIHQVLRKLGYKVNHKKVYRLMKEHKLLHPQRTPPTLRKRSFVKFTSPPLKHPFAVIEIDIKYVYLQGMRRHAYLVTAFDTFTRMAIEWDLGYQMTSQAIGKLLQRSLANEVIKPYAAKAKLVIRTDNGPQFIAAELSKVLQDLGLEHEFIRPGTPEQNGHIESFHNTLRKLVTDRFEFGDLHDAKMTLIRFYDTYNHLRVMKSITYCSPAEFLTCWEKGEVSIGVKNQKQIFFRKRQSV